jgi:hypothetical protein
MRAPRRLVAAACLAALCALAAVAAQAADGGSGNGDAAVAATPPPPPTAAVDADAQSRLAELLAAVEGGQAAPVDDPAINVTALAAPPSGVLQPPPPGSAAGAMAALAAEANELTRRMAASGEVLSDDVVASWAALRATLYEMGALGEPPPGAVVKAYTRAELTDQRRRLRAEEQQQDGRGGGVRVSFVNSSQADGQARALASSPSSPSSASRELWVYYWGWIWWRWTSYWDRITCGWRFVYIRSGWWTFAIWFPHVCPPYTTCDAWCTPVRCSLGSYVPAPTWGNTYSRWFPPSGCQPCSTASPGGGQFVSYFYHSPFTFWSGWSLGLTARKYRYEPRAGWVAGWSTTVYDPEHAQYDLEWSSDGLYKVGYCREHGGVVFYDDSYKSFEKCVIPRTFGAWHPLWTDGAAWLNFPPAPGFVKTNPGLSSGWRECPRYNNAWGRIWNGAAPVHTCAGIPGAHSCRECRCGGGGSDLVLRQAGAPQSSPLAPPHCTHYAPPTPLHLPTPVQASRAWTRPPPRRRRAPSPPATHRRRGRAAAWAARCGSCTRRRPPAGLRTPRSTATATA